MAFLLPEKEVPMPNVTGSVQEITGMKMDTKEIYLEFTLNQPHVGAAAPRAGVIYPTEPAIVTPDPLTGEFEEQLADTYLMLDDAWYTLRIGWQGNTSAIIDFPGWEIRVPSGGGRISELIGRGPGGGSGGGRPNPMLWWVGLTPPPNRNFIWNYLDPEDPDRETGPIPALSLGDILTRWW